MKQKYKELFKNRHVTNVEVDDNQIRVYYRYKNSPKKMIDFLNNKIKSNDTLEYHYSSFADETKNYIYSVAFIKIKTIHYL